MGQFYPKKVMLPQTPNLPGFHFKALSRKYIYTCKLGKRYVRQNVKIKKHYTTVYLPQYSDKTSGYAKKKIKIQAGKFFFPKTIKKILKTRKYFQYNL